MLKSPFLNEARTIVKILLSNKLVKNNVIAIYTMGSFAEGIVKKSSDIDLNIFINRADYKDLTLLKKAIVQTEKKCGRKIDTNLISEKEVREGIIGSRVFPHKYRHALLIYEIKYYNCLLYGKNILAKITFNYDELFEETIKLLLTLGYRLRKLYLATATIAETKKQAVKFATYACKFALINKGIFVYNDKDAERYFMKYFSYLENVSIISQCFEIKKTKEFNISNKMFETVINFIERLAEDRLEGFKKVKKNSKILFVIQNKKLKNEILSFLKKECPQSYIIKWSRTCPTSIRNCILVTDNKDLLNRQHIIPLILFIEKNRLPEPSSRYDYFIRDVEDLKILFKPF
ncbi:nucleotidyltransferase domain-containing protein [Candidatus Woesearchaeota archaeon]|nr:nucleotidyltransferase domain-containing protein [Candidatus Woesearchaeota archaeon]